MLLQFLTKEHARPTPNPNLVALITGITGQDGLYLAALLIQKGYSQVHGIVRKNSQGLPILLELQQHATCLQLHYGDTTDSLFMQTLITQVKPSEIYNFAAQSHVLHSFSTPISTFETNTRSLLNILEACKLTKPRVFHASTSEMYGVTQDMANEESNFDPVSPYSLSKLSCYQICLFYRRTHNIDVRQAISFNHESPFRNELFVTRKITMHIARYGDTRVLQLGNVNAIRDWGHAKDFVKAYWMMMQPKDASSVFVVSTGQPASVRDFCHYCYQKAGYNNLQWQEDGLYSNEKQLVQVNIQSLQRLKEVPYLKGDSKRIQSELGWQWQYSWQEVADEMLLADQIRCSRSFL